MPELPEVETVVRQLTETLPGRRIVDLRVFHGDLLRESSKSFREGLLGSAFESVGRRGKNILFALSEAQFLVVNLGMTGQLLFRPFAQNDPGAGKIEAHPHPGLSFRLDPAGELLYADTRRFGCIRRFRAADWALESARLGPEPLDPGLTPLGLHRRLARSRSPMRSWLLDQTHIAGIGNIYACEALFRAGIHPKRSARSLDPADSENLLQAIRDVLSEAIQARGTTLQDYRTASGDRGSYGPSLQAYGRAGEPCILCNTTMERIVFGNRSAFFCPHCQPGV